MLYISNGCVDVKDGKMNGPVKHGPTSDGSFVMVGDSCFRALKYHSAWIHWSQSHVVGSCGIWGLSPGVNELCPVPRMLPDCAVTSWRENKGRCGSPPWLFVTTRPGARRPTRPLTKTFQSFSVALTIRQAPIMTCEPLHLRAHYAL